MTSVERILHDFGLLRAWRILGLPGEPGPNRDLCSPFREDKKPSMRIYPGKDHLRWYDNGTGEGGDVIDLWAKARGITNSEAIADILRYLGEGKPARSYTMPASMRTMKEEILQEPTTFRSPPDLRVATPDECYELAALRGILPGAFDLGGYLGTLKVGTVYGQKSWIITDKSGRCAEARRFDGADYVVDGEKRKSFCLPGSKKSWPLGLITEKPEFDAVKNILIVEGQPDYFSALSLAIDTAVNFRPVAILGASQGINLDSAPHFEGTKIVIIPHNDVAGLKSVKKWAPALMSFGAEWVQIEPLPLMINDLNEYLVSENPDIQGLVKEFIK